MQERLKRYRAWFADLEQRGHLASFGQPLEQGAGRVVRDKHGAFTDGPYAETKDIVAGLSIILARDYAEAVELAKTNPIFDEGGVIEIRSILKV
jgi:hypothetical protein